MVSTSSTRNGFFFEDLFAFTAGLFPAPSPDSGGPSSAAIRVVLDSVAVGVGGAVAGAPGAEVAEFGSFVRWEVGSGSRTGSLNDPGAGVDGDSAVGVDWIGGGIGICELALPDVRAYYWNE